MKEWGCTGLTERNVVEENLGPALHILKVVQRMRVGAYIATPGICIDYVATLHMH